MKKKHRTTKILNIFTKQLLNILFFSGIQNVAQDLTHWALFRYFYEGEILSFLVWYSTTLIVIATQHLVKHRAQNTSMKSTEHYPMIWDGTMQAQKKNKAYFPDQEALRSIFTIEA